MISQEQINHIRDRQASLKNAGSKLKEHFCGLDDVIDRILKSIEVWYVMPELLTRPLTCNLWGMTGVGKTDLVRRLVKLLSYDDRFCEIELTNEGCPAHPYASSISRILSSSSTIQPTQPGILLLDEIQRFRTIGEDGMELHGYKFQDIWTLLSDGRLPYEIDYDYLMELVYSSQMRKQADERSLLKKNKKKTTKSKHPKPRVAVSDLEDPEDSEESMPSYYSLKYFKQALRLVEPLEVIATWSDEKKLSMVFNKMEDKSIYDHMDYRKLLIFISGNIDEAYHFAKRTDETEIDADVFHQRSLRINILDIKGALRKRFRAEQIARFGNIHVIYPSLSRKTYELIIQRRIQEVCLGVQARCGVTLTVDKSMETLIYNNGVFPVQGTRPVLSTISDAFENSLPTLLLRAMMEQKEQMVISAKGGHIVGTTDKEVYQIPFVGVLDKIREDGRNKADQRAKTAVHEAGHGLVYGILYKVSPLNIASNSISTDAEGYMQGHTHVGSRQMLFDEIIVNMAGQAAEEYVFGESLRTIGMESDLSMSTMLASNMVRRYNMGEIPGHVLQPTGDGSENCLQNIEDTNGEIEKILMDARKRADSIIRNHTPLFLELASEAIKQESLSSYEVQRIFAKWGLELEIKAPKEQMIHDYDIRFKEFLSEADTICHDTFEEDEVREVLVESKP